MFRPVGLGAPNLICGEHRHSQTNTNQNRAEGSRIQLFYDLPHKSRIETSTTGLLSSGTPQSGLLSNAAKCTCPGNGRTKRHSRDTEHLNREKLHGTEQQHDFEHGMCMGCRREHDVSLGAMPKPRMSNSHRNPTILLARHTQIKTIGTPQGAARAGRLGGHASRSSGSSRRSCSTSN